MKRWIAWLSALMLLTVALGGVSAYATEPEETPDTPTPEEAFEALLDEEEFPESYRPALRALHEQYPNWVFRAQHTGLSWGTVLDEESAVGVSLVPIESPDSWKSCEQGAYNPATGTWYGLDGATWVAASREMVAYCLDPRNFLDATAIFQFENLAYSDTCVAEGVSAILSGTFMAGYADTFMQAGKAAGVSPYHLASRARQEQGAKGNALGHGTAPGYAGYYNLFNINAYATSTLTAIQNGARYAATTNAAYHLPWTSAELSIKGSAVILGSSYINREQNTLYLQKFDVTDGGNGFFRHQYMTNILAPASESTTLAAAYSDEVKAGAMEFCIPVYDDMPEAACQKPTSGGNNNNLLTALAVEGYPLTPTFSMYTTTYDLVVGSDVSSITVTATASSRDATVKGIGAVTLEAGMNTVPVTVTAASGAVRTYTLSVYRTPQEGGGEEPPPEKTPTLSSDTYRVDETIRGVAPDTAVADFLKAFSVENATLSLVTAAGLPATGKVGTGHVLQVIVGNSLYASYPVVIRGEVSGDGVIDSLDLLVTQQHLLGIYTMPAPAQEAANASGDDILDSLDLLVIQQHILEIFTIEQ